MEKLVSVLNVEICSISQKSLLDKMDSGVLFTPNIDHLVQLQMDRELYDAYCDADWVICDSKVLFFIMKFSKRKIIEAIPGSSFFSNFCIHHKNNNKIKIFLLGAGPGVAEKAKLLINKKIKRNIVVECFSPSFGFEKDEKECLDIVQRVNNSDATVLVVGVGAPKQEKWIHKYKKEFIGVKLFMGLGATIDFEAGNVPRAPVILQEVGLEWCYRMFQDPKRLTKRYFKDLIFFYYIIKQKLGLYKNPF